MVRVLLTSVLMALISLPQGICFCHYLEAAASESENTCCCEPPAPTKAPPGELPDEHDADCACKLREVLASNSASVCAEPFDFVALLNLADITAADVQLPDAKQLTHFKSLDEPVPLILCALRI